MRVGIATVFTPGIHGGAEFLADGLVAAVREAGHQVHRISVPFHYDAPASAGRAMDQCLSTDFMRYDGGLIDRLICLKFPAYAMPHPDKRVWLLHQHRVAYDLFGSAHGWPDTPETQDLRRRIAEVDKISLGGEGEGSAKAVYTIAERVSSRLRHYSGIESKALYHPPADAEKFRCANALPYIFVPSRLEALKRQDLFLRALAKTPSPIGAVIAGDGGLRTQLQALSEELGLADRVRFVGSITRAEMLEFYAQALAVFFGPLDEDYGYITLEAMLSGKPVVTCRDSGGPLEFVVDGETGYVTDPQPDAIAEALSRLMAHPALAKRLGANGRARYEAMNITWSHVVETLLADLPETSA
ncbi:MAG: glycosyltransferase family 4 protein [Devosia sp.]|uniref:glycosyltransferase family 4 protein n=1 Tax=Devosia sp. TaxID=1871048 RepID=UPI001A089102|nr:glycosyltransferase family 4 protein [Devosia sp.]MBF0680377.1 glycosyltransferase family 4 protein [Devosia sp.]